MKNVIKKIILIVISIVLILLSVSCNNTEYYNQEGHVINERTEDEYIDISTTKKFNYDYQIIIVNSEDKLRVIVLYYILLDNNMNKTLKNFFFDVRVNEKMDVMMHNRYKGTNQYTLHNKEADDIFGMTLSWQTKIISPSFLSEENANIFDTYHDKLYLDVLYNNNHDKFLLTKEHASKYIDLRGTDFVPKNSEELIEFLDNYEN